MTTNSNHSLQKKLQRSTIIAGIVLLSLAEKVSAIRNPAVGALGDDPEKAASGRITLEYFAYLWRAVINVGGLLVLVYYIWGAFDWITSTGDAGKLSKARLKLIHATIGLLLLVTSFTIVGFVGDIFFGDSFNIMELTFPAYE